MATCAGGTTTASRALAMRKGTSRCHDWRKMLPHRNVAEHKRFGALIALHFPRPPHSAPLARSLSRILFPSPPLLLPFATDTYTATHTRRRSRSGGAATAAAASLEATRFASRSKEGHDEKVNSEPMLSVTWIHGSVSAVAAGIVRRPVACSGSAPAASCAVAAAMPFACVRSAYIGHTSDVHRWRNPEKEEVKRRFRGGVKLGSRLNEVRAQGEKEKELIAADKFTDWNVVYYFSMGTALLLLGLNLVLAYVEPVPSPEYVPYVDLAASAQASTVSSPNSAGTTLSPADTLVGPSAPVVRRV